jgi:hypothetical protein
MGLDETNSLVIWATRIQYQMEIFGEVVVVLIGDIRVFYALMVFETRAL